MIIQESLIPKVDLPKRFNPRTDVSVIHYFARIHEDIPSVDKFMDTKNFIDYLKLFTDGSAFKLLLTLLRDTPAIIDYELNRSRKNE